MTDNTLFAIDSGVTVWLGYVSNPVTTAVYIERALRKICRVITVGPTMPVELFSCMGIRHTLQSLDIETSFTPDMSELLTLIPKEQHPDLYLWVDSVARFTHLPQHLDALKCPKACYLIDSHFAPEYYQQFCHLFDYVFVAQLQVLDFFQQRNKRSYWLPLACDPDIHRNYGQERIYPVGFVGGMNENRKQLLSKIERVAQVHYESCFLEDMAQVFSASRIGFNHASLNDLNMRFFELPATGALHLFSTTTGSGQELLFRDEEDIVIYSEDSVEEKVSYYLKNDSLRKQIAERGKLMVYNSHTYDHRVRDLLEVIFNDKADTCSPEELRKQSLPQTNDQSDIESITYITERCTYQPYIGAVVSNRGTSSWPSWLMVYEWEDIFAASLSAEIVMLKDWLKAKSRAIDYNEYHLVFLQLASDLERFNFGKRCIPIVMDVWENDIDLFIRCTAGFDLVFVTSLEVFERISMCGVCNVSYLPYSFPDQYFGESVPNKDIDIIQFGRTNPILDDYVNQLLIKYPYLNYVTTVHHQGKIFFHSSLNGLMELSDTRQKFMTMLGRSTISLVSTAGMDGSRDTGGFNPMSPRFYESAACYCRLIGRFPHNDEFDIFNFNRIADRVESYDEFEFLVLSYVGKPFDRVDEYQDILKHHTTSARVIYIENALRRLHGLRACTKRSRI